MKLTAYALNESPPVLRAARPQREWMSAFANQHPYRCLPMTIANAHGWELLMPVTVEVEWNGGKQIGDLVVRADKPLPDGRPVEHFCRSHFSHGIVTFHTDYLFQTDPGWDLFVSGPLNSWIENATALTGIVEADWRPLPYPFTMNWQVLRPGKVIFAAGEPFCFLFPIAKQALLDVEPEIRRLSDTPTLAAHLEAFSRSRDAFLKGLAAGDPEVRRQGWQRDYFLGRRADGSTVETHLNRLRLKEPIDLRLRAPATAAARRSDPRWEDDSPLNAAPGEETEANRIGRARMDGAGRLPGGRAARVVRTQADAEGFDLVVIENLLGPDDCAALCDAFARIAATASDDASVRTLDYAAIKAADPNAAKLMYDAHKRGIMLTGMVYRLKAPVHGARVYMERMDEGVFVSPEASHGLTGLYFLNDDYEGGELYFTALDLAIRPKRGMLVATMGGFHHERGVTRVDKAKRLTLPFLLTFDKAKADRDLF